MTTTDTAKRRGPAPELPEFIVAVDVETTGFHSKDRIVSLGAVWLPTASIHEPVWPVSFIHLLFDPGRKSHPRAEAVHGLDDWLLRHQEPFQSYAKDVRDFIESGDVVVAHNAEFDLTFINRELEEAGERRISKPVRCTMEGYRELDTGGSASLKAVCSELGLLREGTNHGALEDAWLALMVFLHLHEHEPLSPFQSIGGQRDLFNVLKAPPRPEGQLPRRSKRR